MNVYILLAVSRDANGHPVFESAEFLEIVRDKNVYPYDRQEEYCKIAANKNKLIYIAELKEYAIGVERFEVVRTKAS